MTEFTATQPARLTGRVFLATGWRLGLACLLAVLAFFPYGLNILGAAVPQGGGFFFPPISLGGGVGSPGGERELVFSYQPWGTLLVAALFALLMFSKLLVEYRRSKPQASGWRSGALLLVMFLLMSAFVLWQAPIAPSLDIVSTHFSDVPELALATMILSIYPCFFSSFTSVFLCGTPRGERRASWLPLLLSLPPVLIGILLFLLPFPMYHGSWARFYHDYAVTVDPSPLLAALFMLPTLLGASLLGSWPGRVLPVWLQRSRENAVEAVPLAASDVGAQRAHRLDILWGFAWRLVLIGLMTLTIAGLLLHMSISGGSYMFAPQGIEITLSLSYLPGRWLLPLFFPGSGALHPLRSFWFLTFLPFLLVLPGVLVERQLRNKHTVLSSVGMTFVLLLVVVGAKDLVLCLYDYLVFFLDRSLPFFGQSGADVSLLQVVPLFCETTVLAAMGAITMGGFSRPVGKWSRRLLWSLLGMTSFVASLPPLEDILQNGFSPFLDTTGNMFLLATGLALAVLAAWLGGWLRTLVLRKHYS